jgi:hypothetical protein
MIKELTIRKPKVLEAVPMGYALKIQRRLMESQNMQVWRNKWLVVSSVYILATKNVLELLNFQSESNCMRHVTMEKSMKETHVWIRSYKRIISIRWHGQRVSLLVFNYFGRYCFQEIQTFYIFNEVQARGECQEQKIPPIKSVFYG